VNVVRDPTDLPGPIGKRGPQRIKVDLETVEVTGQLADGTTYHYWTFNKKVPGPFIRLRWVIPSRSSARAMTAAW